MVQLADIVEIDLPITTVFLTSAYKSDRTREPVNLDHVPFLVGTDLESCLCCMGAESHDANLLCG
jgi:hypothetical protein